MVNSKPIILVGANGQVGREIKESAVKEALHLIALDRQQLDISDSGAVEKVFDDLCPALVINAAAYTAVDKAETDRDNALRVNHQGAANLASACAQHDIPLIHISTDYIFDGVKEKPYVENDQAAPAGLYGLSKWQGEEAVRYTLKKHLIIRVSWVFGIYGNNFVKTMLRLGQDRDLLKVVADQYGCPTYACHIAEAILHLSRRILNNQDEVQWGTFHFCGEPSMTWHGFAVEIFRQAKLKNLIDHSISVEPITTADYPTAAPRPRNSVLDCAKINNIFGVKPGSWRDGLESMLDKTSLVKR